MYMPSGTQYSLVACFQKYNGQVLTYGEISNEIGIGIMTIYRNLAPLLQSGRVTREKALSPDRRRWGYIYTVNESR